MQINQGETLRIVVQAKDRGTASGMIRYSLRPDGPLGSLRERGFDLLPCWPEAL